jgi:hypothetical protein
VHAGTSHAVGASPGGMASSLDFAFPFYLGNFKFEKLMFLARKLFRYEKCLSKYCSTVFAKLLFVQKNCAQKGFC